MERHKTSRCMRSADVNMIQETHELYVAAEYAGFQCLVLCWCPRPFGTVCAKKCPDAQIGRVKSENNAGLRVGSEKILKTARVRYRAMNFFGRAAVGEQEGGERPSQSCSCWAIHVSDLDCTISKFTLHQPRRDLEGFIFQKNIQWTCIFKVSGQVTQDLG